MATGLIHKSVPRPVLDRIKETIRKRSLEGESAWRSAQKSEDTITGHWGGKVSQEWSDPVFVDGYSWRYRIEYRKFSSVTEEGPTGSDGIFQIEVDKQDVSVTPLDNSMVKPEVIQTKSFFRKGILFQSKKVNNTMREQMLEQLQDIELLTPNEGVYFEYGPDSFRAATASNVIMVQGFTKRLEDSKFTRLGDFLADEFLECKRGVEGLYYDFDQDTLVFPTSTDAVKRLQEKLDFGFRVQVNAFRLVPFITMNEQANWQRNGF